MFDEVMKRFEQQAPICVMARLALQRAIAPQWIDEVFAEHRQRQYPREGFVAIRRGGERHSLANRWGATMISSGVPTIILAGREESEAA